MHFDSQNELCISRHQFLIIICYSDRSSTSVSSFYWIGLGFFDSNQCILNFSISNKKNRSIFIVSFWYRINLKQYVQLQPSIFPTFKIFGKNVIQWGQAEWFWPINLDLRALSMWVVIWWFQLKPLNSIMAIWKFFFKTLSF